MLWEGGRKHCPWKDMSAHSESCRDLMECVKMSLIRSLTRTVRPKDGDTGGERDLKSDVVELLNFLRGVLETDLALTRM
jgi:hypothetical protein